MSVTQPELVPFDPKAAKLPLAPGEYICSALRQFGGMASDGQYCPGIMRRYRQHLMRCSVCGREVLREPTTSLSAVT